MMPGLVVVSTTTLGSKQFTNVVSFDIIAICSSNSNGESAILLSWKLWVRVPPGAPHMRIKEEHARRSKVHHGSKHDEHTCKNRS